MQTKRTPGIHLISFMHFASFLAAMLVAGSGFRPANAAGVTEQIGNFETAARRDDCISPIIAGRNIFVGLDNGAYKCELFVINKATGQLSFVGSSASSTFRAGGEVAAGDRLVFTATLFDGFGERNLWVSDGTTQGTRSLTEDVVFQSAYPLRTTRQHAAFNVMTPTGLRQLWITEGQQVTHKITVGDFELINFTDDDFFYSYRGSSTATINRISAETGTIASIPVPGLPSNATPLSITGTHVFYFLQEPPPFVNGLSESREFGAVSLSTGEKNVIAANVSGAYMLPGDFAKLPGGIALKGCTKTKCSLWISDGTVAGTRDLVASLSPGSSATTSPATFGSLIATPRGALVQLRQSSTSGVYQISLDEFVALKIGSNPQSPMMRLSDTGEYYFCVDVASGARETWATNAVTDETRKVANQCNLPDSYAIDSPYAYEWRYEAMGPVLFGLKPPGYRPNLGIVRRNLETNQAVPIRGDASIGTRFSNAAIANNGRALFQACTLVDCTVWATDGTAGGSSPVFSQAGQAPTTFMETGEDGYVYWRYKTSNSQTALVRSNGTAGGTRILALLGNAPTGWDSPNGSLRASVSPSGYVSLNAKTYFASCESGNAAVCGIWTSDGTVEGTRLAVPMPPDLTRSPVIVRTDDRLVFYWCQRTGCALYVSDGSPGGTYQATATTFGGVGQAWTGWKGELWTANCRQIAGAAGMAAIMSECVVQRTDGTSGMREAFRLTESDVWQTSVIRPLGDQLLVMLSGPARSKLYAWREGELPRLLNDTLPTAAGLDAAISHDAGGSARWVFGGSAVTDGTPSGTTGICESTWARPSGAFLIGDSSCGAGSPRIWASDLNGRYRTAVFDDTSAPQAFAMEQVLGIVNNRLLYQGFTTKDGTELWSIPIALDRNNADSDDDGIPDTIELVQGTNPNIKDNDIFAPTFTSARLFVMQQYRDFFGREATQVEIDFGVSAISISGRATMVEILLRSPQVLENMGPVVRLYASYFLRNPDYQGLNFWVDAYVSGRWTFPAISNFFATSPEFASRYGSLSNDQFVTLIYRNVLKREPDADGFAFWVKQLNDFAANSTTGRSAGQVMADFSESPENKLKTGALVEAVLLYAIMLKQGPDFAFTDTPPTATEAINTILAKPDYRSRFLPPSP